MKKTVSDFWAEVNKGGPDDCWPFQGYKMANGYGSISVSGVTWLAHRLAWSDHNARTIPEGPNHYICHTCDNPSCCNPKHLYLGDGSTNNKDRAYRMRAPNYKISPAQAEVIRKDPRILKHIAADYGVTIATISNIKRFKTHYHSGGQ